LRSGNRNLQVCGRTVSGAAEFSANRGRVTKQATQSADIEHDGRRAVAFDAR
jgi:hypothetical protein